MKLEKRDLIRWFKKGWAYILVTTLISIAVNSLGITSIISVLTNAITNPSAITTLFALGILSILWGIFVFPMIGGWLIEFIDRKIRK